YHDSPPSDFTLFPYTTLFRSWKTRMGFAVFGMIWNISTLAFIYLMYYTGVIPLLIPVLVTIGAAAILFGIFRSGPPSMGGEVKRSEEHTSELQSRFDLVCRLL